MSPPLRARRWLAAAAAMALIGGRLAMAHPEISMQCRVLFNFDGRAVNALGESWVLDRIFSAELLAQFDLDHDGRFSKEETAAMGRTVLANLAKFRYFTYVSVDGRDVGGLKPFDFNATVDGRIVTYSMVFWLTSPVDPAKSRLKVQIKDPQQFVNIVLTREEPVVLRGAKDGRCRPRVREHFAGRFSGMIMDPPDITLDCHG